MLDKQINDLNVLLNIFHNDERLHLPVLHLISLLEWGIEIIDTAYEKVEFGKDAVGDVDYLRDRMDFRQSITYDKPNPDPNSSKKTANNLAAFFSCIFLIRFFYFQEDTILLY